VTIPRQYQNGCGSNSADRRVWRSTYRFGYGKRRGTSGSHPAISSWTLRTYRSCGTDRGCNRTN